MDSATLASKFDHTLLKPEAGIENIRQLCQEADQYNFHSVCINPVWLTEAFNLLKESDLKLCTVVGFPLGASSTTNKLHEIETSIKDGAVEIDMVMNIGFFKDRKFEYISNEISMMVQNAHGNTIKVIIETGLLSTKEIITASKLVEDSGAHFVKTSTGFSSFGASPEIIQLIKSSLKSNTKIKASGGIKSLNQVKDLLVAGADRIGTSESVIIMKELAGN